MSATDPSANPNDCQRCAGSALERIPGRESILGEDMKIRRVLPSRQRRTVGAWCFLDHFGPVSVEKSTGMRVGPHPHTGLQTFTWPISGEILHRDSLGYTQVIRGGQVNLMTAGRGISHSEESPVPRSPVLHGAQLWIALPDAHRHIEPDFAHYADIPAIDKDGFKITVMAGEMLGLTSPAKMYSPIVGVELLTAGGGNTTLPLRADFEYGLLVLEGELHFCGQRAIPGEMLYLPPGTTLAQADSASASRALLLGGTPFEEEILIWWNFIGRTKAEIETWCAQWNAGEGFGTVSGYDGKPLVAPAPPWAPSA
ncbi:pirin family protein [Sinimarinibacterium sp. NLF-5-8]|uniref:pirin family protein n=1 Tax=Sinimarinibacterium sp. NLF-5-8 TaxID=2698684 RepID=UPI00137BC2E0|nr:pirin family protein [Sinimarinibacterium sp. NLF-5-8]QHS09796.1 pirin family protein [Sinimarinibacterium sp. NLF-5-8]